MAATGISIYQDNIVDECNLLAVHSPLIFLIDITYNGTAPLCYCDIYGGSQAIGESTDRFLCTFDSDQSATIRRYRFEADAILRSFMEDFDDFIQSANSVQLVQKVNRQFTLRFFDGENQVEESVTIIAFAASRQYGQNAALTDIMNNEDILYLAQKNRPVYIYFYNTYEDNECEIRWDNHTISLGSYDEKHKDDMSSWEGSGYLTHPAGWTLIYKPLPDSDFRIFEETLGQMQVKIYKNFPSNYGILALKKPDITWQKGVKTFIKIKYRYSNTNSNCYFFAMAHPPGAYELYGNLHPIPESYYWQELEFEFYEYSHLPGAREPIVGFIKFGTGNNFYINIDEWTIFTKASDTGYYRLKVDNLTKDTQFNFYVNDEIKHTKTVRIKSKCDDALLLKYLDKNGQYRMLVYNDRYQIKDSPQMLGRANKLINSLLTGQSNFKNIGYKNERTILATADIVAEDELDLYAGIYTSPRVYLYIGDGTTDEAKDWLMVTVKSQENIVKNRRGNNTEINIEILLPQHYNITML